MNWLSKLDEIVSNLLPEEDRLGAKVGRTGGAFEATSMMIDPLLTMDLNHGAEDEEDQDIVEDNNVEEDEMERSRCIAVVKRRRSSEGSELNESFHHSQRVKQMMVDYDNHSVIPHSRETTESPSFMDEDENDLRAGNSQLEPITTENSMLLIGAPPFSQQSGCRSEGQDRDGEGAIQHHPEVEIWLLTQQQREKESEARPNLGRSRNLNSLSLHDVPVHNQESHPEYSGEEFKSANDMIHVNLVQAASSMIQPMNHSTSPSAIIMKAPIRSLDMSRMTPSTRAARHVDIWSTTTPRAFNDPQERDVPNETTYFMTPGSFQSSTKDRTTEAIIQRFDHDAAPVQKTSQNRQVPIQTVGESHRTLPPTNIEVTAQDTAELEVGFPLPDWNSSVVLFHPSMNCLGVVHVRALAAQRLPCPVGSTVQAVVSLIPWNGKVRGEPTVAFGQNGVCAKWDVLNEATGCSMVHPWSSIDSPIPVIKLELFFKPIKVFEFQMCSLDLSCKPLMAQPGVWKKQWCWAMPSSGEAQPGLMSDHIPLVLVEAAFFPASHENVDEYEKDDELSLIDITTSVEPSIRPDDASSLRSVYQLKAKNKVHLMALRSFWKPADCAVCKRSLIGWKRGYRCEACLIDCCGDCQLQIDLQIPCGSLLAKNTVKKSIQNKITFENVLTTIAPVEDKYVRQVLEEVQEPSVSTSTERGSKEGYGATYGTIAHRIGGLRIKVHQAVLFETPLPMETDPSTVVAESTNRKVRKGDYYVRVSCMGNSSSERTRTIQNSGKPRFDSQEMLFDVPHYGMEYRLDVIDAYQNSSVGTFVVTAQSLLQSQRDQRIDSAGIDGYLPRSRDKTSCKQTMMKVELRTGFKDGFGSDYFASYNNRNTRRVASNAGAISGWMTVDLSLNEDHDALFGQSPARCKSRPPNKFDIEVLQNHITRISLIVEDIKSAIEVYSYVVSWKKPPLTGFTLFVVVKLCYSFDLEYVGSLPILVLVVFMLYLASARKMGHLKDRFVRRERESRARLEREVAIDASLHRPLGYIQVSVQKGRNLRSRDLGLPGSVGCHIFWHPQRYCESEEAAKRMSSTDKLLMAYHDIGDTNYLYTPNPNWDNLKESNDCKRLYQMLSPETPVMTSSGEGTNYHRKSPYIEFPVLQPIQDQMGNSQGVDSSRLGVSLAPWETMPGAVVVQIRFSDVINMIPGFECTLGEVAIPISKVVEKGECKGWFQVTDVGATHFIRCDEHDEADSSRIFLDFKWRNPSTIGPHLTDTDQVTSIVVAEEMVRAAIRNATNRPDIIKSSMGAVNSVIGLGESVQSIQNTLGKAVDIIERVRNLLNFTDPSLSSLILIALALVWVLLSLIPSRFLVLLCVVAHYGATFVSRFRPLFMTSSIPNEDKDGRIKFTKEGGPIPLTIWLENVFDRIPTDDDLRRVYFWESARVSHIESHKLTIKRRVSRLNQLWKAKWYSAVKVRNATARKETTFSQEWTWDCRFAVVLGRQLLVWASENDFDEGIPPTDLVLLSGHAGLAGLSPVELRELSANEVPRIVNIFGRGIHGQTKMMMLVPNETMKETLEETVLAVALKAD